MGLADAYSQLGGFSYLSPGETFPKARAAASKALEIDDSLADAHADMGYAEWYYDWDATAAEHEFKVAIALNPNSAITHSHYSEFLEMQRRFDESIAEGQRAKELDPLFPWVAVTLQYTYIPARRYEESIVESRRALELDPEAALAWTNIAVAYAMQGHYEQALAEMDKVKTKLLPVTANNANPASQLGWVYAVSGKRKDAINVAKQLEGLSTTTYVDYYFPAMIYAGLGDKDQSFHWLERAYQEHSNQMAWLSVDPFFYPLHNDPHYKDLLRRMGLPQPAD